MTCAGAKNPAPQSPRVLRSASSEFNDETLKTFLFGATIDAGGLRDCYLLPAKTGIDVPPRLLSCGDPQWKAIYEDLQRHSRALGTQLTARGDAIEVRCE